eukprot:SAG22_NODE_12231_length_451_cov_0.937500_1_plen_82_part_01
MRVLRRPGRRRLPALLAHVLLLLLGLPCHWQPVESAHVPRHRNFRDRAQLQREGGAADAKARYQEALLQNRPELRRAKSRFL